MLLLLLHTNHPANNCIGLDTIPARNAKRRTPGIVLMNTIGSIRGTVAEVE